jgi:hypothetical protein
MSLPYATAKIPKETFSRYQTESNIEALKALAANNTNYTNKKNMSSNQKKTIFILTAVTILGAALFLLKLAPFAGVYGALFFIIMIICIILMLIAFSMGNVSIKYILSLIVLSIINFGVFIMYYPSIPGKLVWFFLESAE